MPPRFSACLFPLLLLAAFFAQSHSEAQTITNGDFNSSSLKVSLAFSANLTTAHLDQGWVGSSSNARLWNTITATTDDFDPATAKGNFRTLGGVANSGYLVANDGADTTGTTTVWNLSTGGGGAVSGLSIAVVVKYSATGGAGSASATLASSAGIQYAIYGFTGDRTALDAAFPTTLVPTTANTLDDPQGRPGFTTLATGNLTAMTALNAFETQTIPFSFGNQQVYDFYLIGFTAPANGGKGAAIDNVRLLKTVPAPPSAVSVSSLSSSSLQVSFQDNSLNEETFLLAQRPTGVPAWTETTLAASPNTGLVSATVMGLLPATEYEFRLLARNNGGDSAWSDPASVTTQPPPPPPAQPGTVSLGAPNWFTLTFSFLDQSTNEEGFVVSYRVAGSSDWTELLLPPVSGSGTTITEELDELAANTTYEFRVRAINTGGASEWTDLASQSTPAPPVRPNILFIIADDLGPDGLGSFGSETFAASTPRIDQLAANGVRFDRVFCTGICSPSRAQYVTGQYPFRNGVLDIDGSNFRSDPHKPSLIRLLNNAGYHTGGAGKDTAISDFAEYLSGPTGGYWNVSSANIGKKGPSPIVAANYPYHPDALQAFALNFLDRNVPAAGNNYRPFYLQYGLIQPHTPIQPTPDSTPGETNLTALYHDNIRYIDKVVGQLTDKLAALGILESTVLIFTGDNGSLGTYQSRVWDPNTSSWRTLSGGKADRGSYLEGSALVPLVVHWPEAIFGNRAGILHRDLVDFTDFLPTYADLAQIQPLPEWELHGTSFVGRLWKTPGYQPKEWIFSQLENNWYIRGEHFRLNRDGRLYDMADAPFGMTEILPQNDTPESAVARTAYQAILDEFDPTNGPTYEAHQDNEWSNPAWAWKVANFNSTERWETPTSGDSADPDGDGVPNIFERAFGWNPKNGSDSMPDTNFNGTGLTISVPQISLNDTTVVGQSSETLMGWLNGIATGSGPFSFTAEPSAGSRTIFLRLRAARMTPWNEP